MKRFRVIFVLLLILIGLFQAPGALAAFNVIPNAEEVSKIIDERAKAGQTSKELYSFNSVAILMDSIPCFIMGCSSSPQSAFYYGNSAVAGISNIMLAMYTTPPANFMAWVHDTAQTLGFEPKQTYAQGIGFTGLSQLLPIWKAFRNISYALLAAIMVVIGFMIMFRQKIDPKTVVTVQNALPKIVLALLLITFSYAIAAFMIDLMYLVMAIIINLLVGASNGALGADTAGKYLSGGLGTALAAMFGGGFKAIDDVFKLLFFNGPVPWIVNAFVGVITIGFIPALMLILITVIISIALLFGIIRIAFMLISAYIQILVSILIAPFQLMTVALPGSTSFSNWIKNLVANLSVFPITAAMLLVGTILAGSNGTNGDMTMWTPPLLTGSSPAGTGAIGVTGLIGLGILLTIPNVANSVKEALKAKAPVEAGLGAILGPVGAGAGQAFQLAYQGMFIASPFLHKTSPSTPGGRQEAAAEGGIGGVIKTATGSEH